MGGKHIALSIQEIWSPTWQTERFDLCLAEFPPVLAWMNSLLVGPHVFN